MGPFINWWFQHSLSSWIIDIDHVQFANRSSKFYLDSPLVSIFAVCSFVGTCHTNSSFVYFFLDKVSIHFNMLGSVVLNRIKRNTNSCFIITVEFDGWFHCNIKFFQEFLQPQSFTYPLLQLWIQPLHYWPLHFVFYFFRLQGSPIQMYNT